jgi:hypothetical protein
MRRPHRGQAAPVEAYVVGFAIMTAALFWLVVISVLWGDR